MTVSELIKKLKDMPRTAKVVVCGYEGGYNEVPEVREVNLLLDYNVWKPPYYGRHEIGVNARVWPMDEEGEVAVLLEGGGIDSMIGNYI